MWGPGHSNGTEEPAADPSPPSLASFVLAQPPGSSTQWVDLGASSGVLSMQMKG